jgi:hypothetical protein
VRLLEPFAKLRLGDRPSPEIAVLLRARRDDSETPARPRRHPSTPGSVHDRRVDVVLGTIAVDGGSRGSGDDSGAAPAERSPDEPVDDRIFER